MDKYIGLDVHAASCTAAIIDPRAQRHHPLDMRRQDLHQPPGLSPLLDAHVQGACLHLEELDEHLAVGLDDVMAQALAGVAHFSASHASLSGFAWSPGPARWRAQAP